MHLFRYSQQKFNLLREESEGYSKLVVLLTVIAVSKSDEISQVVDLEQSTLNDSNVERVSNNIQSLIGITHHDCLSIFITN